MLQNITKTDHRVVRILSINVGAMDRLNPALVLLTVIQTSGRMNMIVGVGESAVSNSSVVVVEDNKAMVLWCDGDDGGWDVCKWYRPNFGNTSDRDSCVLTLNHGDCPQGQGFSHWSIARRGTWCSLAVGPVQSNDIGQWTCLLSPKIAGPDGKFQEISIERQDMQAPNITFDPGNVSLADGDSYVFQCKISARVNKPPSSHWLVGQAQNPGNYSIEQGTTDQGVQTWTINTSLRYMASVSDTGLVIQCVASLVDDLDNHADFSKSWNGLTVTPVPAVRAGFATWEIILLVTVPLIFIVLMIIILVCCWVFGLCCFSSRKKKRQDQSDNIYTTTMQAPIPSKSKMPAPVKKRSRGSSTFNDIDHLTPTITPPPAPVFTLPWDPYTDIPDQLTHYECEGGGSSAGSLSSLDTSWEEDQDLDLGEMFRGMRRQFRPLARLYKEDSDDNDRDLENDNVSYESWV